MSRRRQKPPQRIRIPIQELNAIVERTRSGPLPEAEQAILKAAVATLARIAAATEPQRPRPTLGERLGGLPAGREHRPADLFALAVETVVAAAAPAAVVVPTRTGATARAISRLRLPVWIAAPTPSPAVSRQLRLSCGVEPMVVDEPIGDWSDFVRGWVAAEGLRGHFALLVRGPSPRHPDANHTHEIVDLANR